MSVRQPSFDWDDHEKSACKPVDYANAPWKEQHPSFVLSVSDAPEPDSGMQLLRFPASPTGEADAR